MENETMEKLRKELKKTRALTVFNSLLTLVLIVGIVGVILLARPAFQYVDQMKPVIETLSKIDANSLNNLGKIDAATLNKLSELDIEALNKLVKSMDTEELKRTTENFNDAVKSMQELGRKLGSVFGGN